MLYPDIFRSSYTDFSLELGLPGDEVRAVCDQLPIVQDLILINHVPIPSLLNGLVNSEKSHLLPISAASISEDFILKFY